MALGEGMDKGQWEDHMCKFFHRLLKGSSLNVDPSSVGIRIRYATDPVINAQWETTAIHKEYDKQQSAFLDVGPPPADPTERKKWDAERKRRHMEWEQRKASRSGKKCSICGSWDTQRIEPKDLPPDQIISALGAARDYLVCHTCSTRVMWDSQELEVAHDTEIIFLADIVSRPFMHKNKTIRLRNPELYVVTVNGRHENWKEEEVRRMMQTMFAEEIVQLWTTESAAAFRIKMAELAQDKS